MALLASYVIQDTHRPPRHLPARAARGPRSRRWTPFNGQRRAASNGSRTKNRDTISTTALPAPLPTAHLRSKRYATFQRWKDAVFKTLTQLPMETTCSHAWAHFLTWPEEPCTPSQTIRYTCWVQIELRVSLNSHLCVFLIHNHVTRWILRPEDTATPVCQTVAMSGGLQYINVSTEAPVGTTQYELKLITFPEGVRVERGKTRILDCDCPKFHPPPLGGLVPVDLVKTAFTNPVQTMIYLHYQWDMKNYTTGVCRWADAQWEQFLKQPLEALQQHRHRRSLSDFMSFLGLGVSAANTLSIGQEVAQRRTQVSTAADLLEQTHQEMIYMAANSFSLEEAQKVKSLSIVVEAFAKTANIMSEIGSRDQVMAQCLYRAGLDIEDVRMLLRDLSHHHLPPLLTKEINKHLPDGIRVIPKRSVQLIENPVLEVTKYTLNIGVSMTVYTGTPLLDLHEYQYIGHAVGLTTVPEQVPTNGTHVVKSVCVSDDQALICQSPIEWVPIDDWADQTPQRFTDMTWSAMTPMGDICVNTPTLTYANRTCAYDRPGCFTSNSIWRAPHGALVPPIKVDYNATTSITSPSSPADDALAAELKDIVYELAGKVSVQEKKQTAILNAHHALTDTIIAHTKVLKRSARKLVVQVENEKWWGLFTTDTSPMGIVRICVAALICSIPLLWLCNIALLTFGCTVMRKHATPVHSISPQLTMAQFQQSAVRQSPDPRCVAINLDVDQIQQLKAWVGALQLPLDAQRLVTTVTLPTGCTPHIKLTASDAKPIQQWVELNPRALGRRVALQSSELHITPRGIALVFDECTPPLVDLFMCTGYVPICALSVAPGYTVQSLTNLIRDNDEKMRHNTSCDTLMKIGSESFACVCERVFDGIVKLRTAETVL